MRLIHGRRSLLSAASNGSATQEWPSAYDS
jgi:hypothetical protein